LSFAETRQARRQLPRLLRTTAFRLTLVFLALFAASAAAFLVYIYVATAGEATRGADAYVSHEIAVLQGVYGRSGVGGLRTALAARSADDRQFLYRLDDAEGRPIAANFRTGPLPDAVFHSGASFHADGRDLATGAAHTPCWGRAVLLADGSRLVVAVDVSGARVYLLRIVRASWGAGVLVIVLGLAGGLVVSRNVARSVAGLSAVVARVEGGDLDARAPVRGVRDEYDELATGLNAMLDRVQRLMAGVRHAGDAIAHDLRSPLTRLRARLETALIEVEAGKAHPTEALARAVDDADQVLKTFHAVLAIARLQAAGRPPNVEGFDPSELARGVAELYQPLCEDKGVSFACELGQGLKVRADRDFMAQALANLLDNAVKYTPPGGAVMLRTRRRSSGEIEFSVTDTGPGVAQGDRDRVLERFVRLEASRSQPGAGLGLSLVAAVAEAHRGRVELSEGPGVVDGKGPGLRVALLIDPAA